MKKILFITPYDLLVYPGNGGLVGANGNFNILKLIPNINVTALTLSRHESNDPKIISIHGSVNRFNAFFYLFRGYSAHLTPKSESLIFDHLKSANYDAVFFDSPLLGKMAKKVKRIYPDMFVITYFHNVEYVYALHMLLINGLPYIPVFLSNVYNENRSVKHSDILISINKRDKLAIEKLYKRRVSYTHTVWLEGCYLPPEKDTPDISSPLEVLFVGSWFFANVTGIKWFIKKVLPRVNIHLTIAGQNMERLKGYETDSLRVVGTVDNLDETYARCDCVVSPIFHGSGMKVKIADAFRHGKTVVGTSESFTGYHITHRKEGYICKTAGEFIQAFRDVAGNQKKKINRTAVSYFRQYLSKTYALNNYITIFKNIYRDTLVS
jgi:hypothetical protein